MSNHNSNNIPQVSHSRQEISWNELIMDAEEKVNACQIEIQKLTKSIAFFKKQEDGKIPFPAKAKVEQKDNNVESVQK